MNISVYRHLECVMQFEACLCVGWGVFSCGDTAVNVQPQKPPDPPTPAPCQQDILSWCILGSLILRPKWSMPRDVCECRQTLTTYVFKSNESIFLSKSLIGHLQVLWMCLCVCACKWVGEGVHCVWAVFENTRGPNPGTLGVGWLIFNPAHTLLLHLLLISTQPSFSALFQGQEVERWGALTFWKKATVSSEEGAASCPKWLF